MEARQKKKRKVKWIRAGIIVFLVLFIIYWIIIYFLVSAALVPSFMEKLDSFERITEKGYAEQTHTSDIAENRKEALEETKEWLSEKPPVKKEILSEDGFRLIASEFRQPDEKDHQWAVLLHGYTGRKEEMYPFALEYYKRGYHCLVPDLRCQGESEGDFIGMGLTDSSDVLLWIKGILDEDPDAEIVLHGQSMGAATALMLSGRSDLPENVKAAVSDSSYIDAYTMFGEKAKDWFNLPAFPIVNSMRLMLLLRGGYDLYKASPIDAASDSDLPTLFIHGSDDKMISVDQAYALYETDTSAKELLIIDGAGHGQPQDKDPEKYYGTVFAFLSGIE